MKSDNPRRAPLDYAALVLVSAAGLLLLAGIVYAFAVTDARSVGGSDRFRLLAQASSPFVAGLALTAVSLVVHERRQRVSSIVAATVALALGSVVSLLALLLAVSGIVVDLTAANTGAMFRLSNVIGRLATVALDGFALWLSSSTPLRVEPTATPVVGDGDAPVHS